MKISLRLNILTGIVCCFLSCCAMIFPVKGERLELGLSDSSKMQLAEANKEPIRTSTSTSNGEKNARAAKNQRYNLWKSKRKIQTPTILISSLPAWPPRNKIDLNEYSDVYYYYYDYSDGFELPDSSGKRDGSELSGPLIRPSNYEKTSSKSSKSFINETANVLKLITNLEKSFNSSTRKKYFVVGYEDISDYRDEGHTSAVQDVTPAERNVQEFQFMKSVSDGTTLEPIPTKTTMHATRSKVVETVSDVDTTPVTEPSSSSDETEFGTTQFQSWRPLSPVKGSQMKMKSVGSKAPFPTESIIKNGNLHEEEKETKGPLTFTTQKTSEIMKSSKRFDSTLNSRTIGTTALVRPEGTESSSKNDTSMTVVDGLNSTTIESIEGSSKGSESIIDSFDEDHEYQTFVNRFKSSNKKCIDPTGRPGTCQEYFMCSTLYSNKIGKINLQDYRCLLGDEEVGICCPKISNEEKFNTRGGSYNVTLRISNLIRDNLANSIHYGERWVREMERIELELLSKNLQVKKNSPAFGHNKFFPSSKRIRDVSNVGFSLLQASNDLSERFQLPNEFGGIGLKNFRTNNRDTTTLRCPFTPKCFSSKYRRIDGACNNPKNPKMGQQLTPLSRILPPNYADGRWSPRISVAGFSLPSPRKLSQTILQDENLPDDRFTLMLMQFGQFLDHDLSSVPIFTFQNGTGIDCCNEGNFLPPNLEHPNCLPIDIPESDPFYSRFGQRCMNFVRSRLAPRIDCSLGYADQMNALTHWIDASNVYGSSEEEAIDLRLFDQGLLRFSQLEDRRMLLPLKSRNPKDDIDYKAGDDRVNEMQGLMIMHLIWFREHNRLALALSRINPLWNDEQLYQEARRILIAEYQHIIYNEWLPIVIGSDYMDLYGILPKSKGYFHEYDADVDASVENSFSTAGFRMGHSLVQGIVHLINEIGQPNEVSLISRHKKNAENARAPEQVDKWIRGLAQASIQGFDPFITEHLNGRLFQNSNRFGMDLGALNVQRGRDHGLPGYNEYRELCQTGKRATSFREFNDWIPIQIIRKLQSQYAHPDDVDLWIGALSEKNLHGSLLGPTFTCIVGDQFARSKKGDRYFYDVGNEPHSFTLAQLREIRRVSFARILCDNADNLEFIQPFVFLSPNFEL